MYMKRGTACCPSSGGDASNSANAAAACIPNGTGLIDPHPRARRGHHLLRIEAHAILEHRDDLANHRRISSEIAVQQHEVGVLAPLDRADAIRSEEHTSELQSQLTISY